MQCSLRFLTSAMRPLSAASLLHTVRGDPGMTTHYYANRYFGIDKVMEIEHLMWQELKKHGKVTLDRIDGPDAPPRWAPLFYYPKRHSVLRHKAEDEDLSFLREAAAMNDVEEGVVEEVRQEDMETAVLRVVRSTPHQDIQFYVNELSEEYRAGAPLTFRRLREAGLLQRDQTPQGNFTWSE